MNFSAPTLAGWKNTRISFSHMNFTASTLVGREIPRQVSFYHMNSTASTLAWRERMAKIILKIIALTDHNVTHPWRSSFLSLSKTILPSPTKPFFCRMSSSIARIVRRKVSHISLNQWDKRAPAIVLKRETRHHGPSHPRRSGSSFVFVFVFDLVLFLLSSSFLLTEPFSTSVNGSILNQLGCDGLSIDLCASFVFLSTLLRGSVNVPC